MFVSFIVPVYNAQTHLAACLDSLLQQDLPPAQYQILCVDDGSTDASPEILARYAAAHPQITVLRQENQGVCAARNAGLTAAQGQYIWFVDADDFIRANCLAALQAACQGCDQLTLGAHQFSGTLTQADLEGPLAENAPWYDAVVWRSLLRRQFLLDNALTFRHPELTHGEDGMFMYELWLCQPVVRPFPEIVYCYRENPVSAENAKNLENRQKKLRSHLAAAALYRRYYCTGQANEETANRLMLLLWSCMYDVAGLPGPQARQALAQLKQAKLFPLRRPRECTLTQSYLIQRPGLVGRVFNGLCLRLHTWPGYLAFRLLYRSYQQLFRR